MQKRNDCCDSFNEIDFQIYRLMIMQIEGGLITLNLCHKRELESRKSQI